VVADERASSAMDITAMMKPTKQKTTVTITQRFFQTGFPLQR
jgi:hypothetical protein